MFGVWILLAFKIEEGGQGGGIYNDNTIPKPWIQNLVWRANARENRLNQLRFWGVFRARKEPLWWTFFWIGNLSQYNIFDGKTRINIYWKGAIIQSINKGIGCHYAAGDIVLRHFKYIYSKFPRYYIWTTLLILIYSKYTSFYSLQSRIKWSVVLAVNSDSCESVKGYISLLATHLLLFNFSF